MNRYISRIVDEELNDLLPQLPAISLEGSKGVGKTETATRRANTVHALDDPARREIIQADPSRLTEGDPPVLIDEWQRVPESWDIVRRAVDRHTKPGQFLLTGSAAPEEKPTHSGAGRIVTLRMRPLSLAERRLTSPTVSLRDLMQGNRPDINGETDVTLEDYTEEILSSGYPGFQNLSGRPLRSQLDGYLERIVDTDFEQLGRQVRKPETLRRWMRAYAAATSTTATYETIRDAATGGRGDKPAKTTTRPYREILERLWIMEQVPAWLPSKNYFSRLSRPPKHHLADPALAARLLGIRKEALLRGESEGPEIPRNGTLLGHLFESLVTLSIQVYAQTAEAKVGHLRTKGGRHEVDLIVEREDQKIIAIEVKLSRTVDEEDLEHLKWLKEKAGEDVLDCVIVHTGPRAYRREDEIAVIPAAVLSP